MAITDDSDWSAALTEVRGVSWFIPTAMTNNVFYCQNDIVMPKPRHLTERILAMSTPVLDESGTQILAVISTGF